MVVETIFSSPLGQTALVFVLVFTLLFALLQKSKILGDGKKQTDALISLAIALLVISVGYAMDIITTLIPFLAVGLVIILVFLLLWGSFYHGNLETSKGVKIAAGIIALIAVVVAVLYITGAWDYLRDWIVLGNSGAFGNIVLVVIVIIAIVVVMASGGEKKKD
jgi:peptidoglycan/LPS O-acetylase OafA/YrhL